MHEVLKGVQCPEKVCPCTLYKAFYLVVVQEHYRLNTAPDNSLAFSYMVKTFGYEIKEEYKRAD